MIAKIQTSNSLSCSSILASAPETFAVYWTLINWDKVKANVKSLQLRIAKAICRGLLKPFSPLIVLEPCAGKLACTILRGGRLMPLT